MVWQVSEAAKRFDPFFQAAVQQGPQTVSQHGVEVAVLVSFKEWDALKTKAQNRELEASSQETH